jgi:hypothetical protein
LVCTSFSLMPMILRFGLFMESLSSCIFPSQLLSLLTNRSSVFLLSHLFCPQVLRFCLLLVLFCWSGFPLYFIFDLRKFLFPEFLFDSIF